MRYRLPLLLSLLSRQPPAGFRRPDMMRQQRAAQLRRVIRLAKEGLREYQHKLDALQRQFSLGPWDREDHADDLPVELREREKISNESRDSREVEDYERDDEPCRLDQPQTHRLFEKLAIRRCRLNARGYPYTADVNDLRQRVFPGHESLTQDDVEDAWDDWRNNDGKRLFRRHEFHRHGREERPRREHAERVDVEEKEEIIEPDDDRHRLSQEQFEAIFRKLRRDGAQLNRRGCPSIDDVLETQRELFELALEATAAEIELAFERWEGCDAYRRHRDRGNRESEEEKMIQRSAKGERSVECRPAGRAFPIFDEILLDTELRSSDFSPEHIPKLPTVNQRLAKRGESQLESEHELRREWREYLICAARSRGQNGEYREYRVEVAAVGDDNSDEIDVRVDEEVTVTREIGAPNNGRKRNRP
jgi:hypothetical protein